MIRNPLYAPSIDYDLIPPFMMRSDGVVIKDVPITHCEDPSFDDHSITIYRSDLCIALQLNGVLSFFHMRVPSERELHECDKIFLTPDSSDWNPHCQSYELNERSMLDFEGKH